MRMLQIKLDNERAKFAFDKVNNVKLLSEKKEENSSNNEGKENGRNGEIKEGKEENSESRENKGKNDNKEVNKDKYLIACKNAPSQMKINGFGMTMAYIFSKNDSKPLYDDIVEWLSRKFYPNDKTVKSGDFLKKIVNSDSFEYMQMSKEAMTLLIWMKRFAEGMLK